MTFRSRHLDLLLFPRMQFVRVGRRGLCLHWCLHPECRTKIFWDTFGDGSWWLLHLGPLEICNHPIYY